MKDGLSRLRGIWDNLSQANRVVLVAIVFASIVAGAMLFTWAATPEFAPLVSNPSSTDLQGIIALLKEKRVNYRTASDGKTIEVPASQRPELVMSLYAAGLMNSGSIGYALIDKMPFGATQGVESTTFRRALEGELENTIETLEQVSRASVKIAPGDDSPFASEKREPSAAIVVHARPGQELGKANVKAIVNLVSHSYAGLTSRNVTLVDGGGHELWNGARDGGDAVTSDERRDAEQAYESALQRVIEDLVKTAVGPNRYSVVVKASLDLDQTHESKREVTGGVPKDKDTTTETYKGSDGSSMASRTPSGLAGNAGGAAGAVSLQGTDAGARGALMSSETARVSYDTSYSQTEVVKTPGEVKTVSVALLVDNSVPDQTVSALEDTIKTTIGADAPDAAGKRLVSVKKVAFDTTKAAADKAAALEAASAERMNQILTYGVPIALMLLMLFILARSLRRAAPVAAGRQIAGGATPLLAGAAEGPASLDIAVTDAGLAGRNVDEALREPVAVYSDGTPRSFDVIQEAFDANLESILQFSKSKPEIVASLLRSWMADERK